MVELSITRAKMQDVVTFAFFIPEQQSGGVIFTDVPDVGHEMIDEILNVLYPRPCLRTNPLVRAGLQGEDHETVTNLTCHLSLFGNLRRLVK